MSPPRIDEVIIKRLRYALGQLEQTGRMTGFPAWLSVNSVSLLRHLKVLLESFEKGYELMESIDNMSGGNVREALRFVIAFLGSGHVMQRRSSKSTNARLRHSGLLPRVIGPAIEPLPAT